MNNLPALLGSAATRGLTTTGANALANVATNLTSGLSIPLISKLANPSTISTSAGNAIANAGAQRGSIALSQLLPSQSGSAIDGVINRNTGIVLPSASTPTYTQIFGEKSLGNTTNLTDLLGAVQDDAARAGGSLAKNTKRGLTQLRKDVTSSAASDRAELMAGTAGGATSWSDLPKLKTSEIKSLIGESGADVRPSLRGKLSEINGRSVGDPAWGETFPDMTLDRTGGGFQGDINDILERYDTAYEARHAGSDFNDENIQKYLLMNPEEDAKYSQLVADVANNKQEIPINQLLGKGQSIPVRTNAEVSGVTATEPMANATTPATDAQAVSNATKSTSPIAPTRGGGLNEAQENVAEAFNLSGAGAGQGGGGGRITVGSTASPEDYGFNQPLENADGQKVIKIQSKVGKSTWKQKSVDFDTRNWLDSMNATRAQYQDVFADKSGSVGGYYKNAAERGLRNGLQRSNFKDSVQAMLDARMDIVNRAEALAANNGLTVALPDIELTPAETQSLMSNGVNLDMALQEGRLTPPDAEELHRLLQRQSVRLRDSSDAAAQERGLALKNAAKKLSESIDKTMDTLGLNYKDEFLKNTGAIGEDMQYLNSIASNGKDLKFSEVRRDMSDLMSLKNLETNKMKAGKTFNIAGVDTGVPNPLGTATEKLKSKFYQKAAQAEAKLGGAGGGTGGGTTGGGGYVFDNGSRSSLSGLLGNAKKIAPYAVGAGIGLMMGGNRGGGDSDIEAQNTSMLGGNTAQPTQETVSDPYNDVTIGGYTYAELEDGYFNAMAAGDTNAAKQIASLMDVLEGRVSRVADAQEKSQKSSTMSAGMNVLNQLYALYKKAGGSQGIIGGTFTGAMNNITGGAYNTDVATYDQTRALTSSLLARALGEKGTLSDTDRKYINDNLPKMTDDPAVAEKKFNAIYQLLEAAQ